MQYLTLLLLAFSFFSLNAQDCPPGDVTITCQDELDAFEAQYPNCTQINGNFTLMDDEYACFGLTDPNFPALERITGHLRVWTYLSADAFPSLQYVGGGIGTDDDFYGTLAVLDTVMGNISMDNSYQSVSFPTCPQLKYIGGNLGIYTDEGGLLDSHDFPALEYIGGNLYDYSHWTDSDFSGFTNLRYIGGDIDIEEGEIGGFNALDTVGGDLILRKSEFDDASVKVNITGMNQLQYIGGNFKLSNIDSNQQCVEDLSGLSQLNYIGGDFEYIWQYEWDGFNGCSNPLTTLNGLQQLKQVGGNITIDRNDLLNLDFLTQLESIGGNLEITGNDLESIDGLHHTVYIGGELIIEDNSNLSECAIQAVCDHINSGGMTTIANNMSGCNSVAEVEALCPSGDCLSGGITFSSQVEIDNFASNYSGCLVIQGLVIIEEAVSGDITNLDSLIQLRVINGSLTIQNNAALVSLFGLDNLNEIAGDIIIQNNNALNDISALSDINHTSITNLHISNNNNLAECAITSICSYFIIDGTATVSNNVIGCDTVAEITDACGSGDCPQEGVVFETQQEIEAYFFAYPECTQISGNLHIGGGNSSDIHDLSPFSNIESVSGSLLITSMQNLINLEGLNNLKSVSGNLRISLCDSLSDISALSNLHTVGGWSLSIRQNAVLTNLHGLHNLSNFGGECLIYGNSALTSFSNFGISTFDRLIIEANNALTDLNGLGQLDTLSVQLDIKNNDNLITLSGLELKAVETIYIGDNQSLTNLQGLHNLENIGERFFVVKNHALPNFDGLQALRTIESHFIVEQNNSLVDFEGLDALNEIGQNLDIQGNQTLTSLQGLQNLEDIGGLIIKANVALSQCAVQGVCDYLNNGGSATITSNLSGCNSATEVEEACQSLPIEMTAPLRVHLKDKTALLQWRTSTEINNSGFEIQRSGNGIEWEKIGWQVGQGNTTTPQSYTYTDRAPLFGTSYYRLKQVDFNGDTEYSNIVSLQYFRNDVTVYPNPVKELLYLHTNYSSVQKITMYDSVGSQVIEIANPGTDIDVSTLPKGIYVLKITVDDEDFYEKILVE